MNKRIIGMDLKSELAKGYDITRLSRWAFRLYSENIRSLDPSLRETLETIFAMEEDPQFELSLEELSSIADHLITEGEKEELAKHLPDIKETAADLGEHWIMCPLCQESWENYSTYAMVRCPKCSCLLHNPAYKG